MLSRHALVVAAIFVPYVILMTGLGVYIWRTSRTRAVEEDQDDGSDDREPARWAEAA